MANVKISNLTAATTPLAGTEVLPVVQSGTTVKASIANVQTATYSGGTANGVAYLNGSKVLTTGSALVFDGTNLGVGVTPTASSGAYKVFEIGASGNSIRAATSDQDLYVSCNLYYNSGWKFGGNGYGALYNQYHGTHSWLYTASNSSGAGASASSLTTAMTLDASGRLGLGTSSPTTPLQIQSAAATGVNSIFCTGSTTAFNFWTISNTSGNARIGVDSSSGGALATGSSAYSTVIGSSTATSLHLVSNGVVGATLDTSGNLLVGTTTTDYKFRVNGTSHFGDGYDNGVYGQVEITRPANQGTQFHLSFVRQGTQISGMGFLNNSSTFAIQNASTNAGSGVTLAVNGTSWGTTSDERTKDILGGVDNALQKLSNWRTVYFKYKTDAEAQTQRVGLIAQDVQATLPEAVSIEEDEIKTLQLRYTEVIPVLVKAIQEQQALITQLTARITALESA
jgi:hypothetical protein